MGSPVYVEGASQNNNTKEMKTDIGKSSAAQKAVGKIMKLSIGNRCLGFVEALGEVFPDSKFQRCGVHFYRNIFSVTPLSKSKEVVAMLKAIHAQEDLESAREKSQLVIQKLKGMKLPEAASRLERGN